MENLDWEPKSMTCMALHFHHCGLQAKCQTRGAWDAHSPGAESLGRQIIKKKNMSEHPKNSQAEQ